MRQERLQVVGWSFFIIRTWVSFVLKLVESGRMDELTAVSIWAIRVLVELLAQLRLVPRRHMLLLLQLAFSMCKGTRVTVGAVAFLLEGPTEFCLDFDLVVF